MQNKIIHERKLALVFNYAYEVNGQGLVSDAVYEYGLSLMKEYKRLHPEEWDSCDFYKEYFVENDDWEYTGSGVPRTESVKSLHDEYVSNGKTFWRAINEN